MAHELRHKRFVTCCEARGRASEHWGEAHLDADRWLHTMELPNRVELADLVLTDLIRLAREIGGPLARDSADKV